MEDAVSQPLTFVLGHERTVTELDIVKSDWMWIESPMGKDKFRYEYSQDVALEVVQVGMDWGFQRMTRLNRSFAPIRMPSCTTICVSAML
jgi:anaerobic selenocysteine-containing dehydrogenase